MNLDNHIKQEGLKNKVPISMDDTLCFICKTINENNFSSVLEIGTAIGYGAITIAENTNCKAIDSVEIDELRFKQAKINIANHNLENKINLHLMDALNYLKTTNKKYDFVYLDGPKGQYVNYLPYIIKILNVGGILVADNLNFHGMVTGEIPISKGCRAMIKGLKKYIQTILSHPQLKSQILQIGDGVGVSIKIKN